jgi:hypothetical protein
MPEERSTPSDWLTPIDAVSLLDAPDRESPSLIDTSRAPFALAMLLIPLLIVIAGISGMLHAALRVLTLPRW